MGSSIISGQSSTGGRDNVVSIVIPLYNQVDYTRLCVESLRRAGLTDAEVLLIDNGSGDGTGEYLATCTDLRVIRNAENLGCSGAWNQGVRETGGEWVVILNNDVIVSPGWLEGLVAFASEGGYDVVTPAIREGEYNYDIEEYGRDFVRQMGKVARRGVADGICFMVHRRVFDAIGLFDENFRIGQFEDTDFFRRATGAGFRLGTTGRSFIHHFGSITQKAMMKNRQEPPHVAANRAYYRKKWKLSWWKRFTERRIRRVRDLVWRVRERLLYGHTLKEKWYDGTLHYF